MESDRIKSWPVKDRPREKLLAEGAEKQTDADLLAVILRVGRGTFKKGVPWGRPVGGERPNLPVITKAGAFASPRSSARPFASCAAAAPAGPNP